MSVRVRNSRELIDPNKFRLKMLLIAPTGFGKTEFLGTVPDIGIAAVETGDGKGVLTIAQQGVDFCEPSSYGDLDAVMSGNVFRNHSALGLDSLSAMVRTVIKDAALAMPGSSLERRKRGIPDLSDYGVIAEMGRQLLAKALYLDKHLIVTALIKTEKPDAETGRGEYLVGPDLPGQLFLTAPAMFDIVLVGTTEQRIVETAPGKKERITERFWVTAADGLRPAKCRIKGVGGALFAPRELYDLRTGAGTFPYFYNKVKNAYQQLADAARVEAEAATIVEEGAIIA